MKRILLLLVLVLAVCSVFSQKIYPWDGYIFPFCTDENPYGITYKSGTRGHAAFPKKHDIGCLGTAPGPVWYYMQIDQPGDLLIYIEQYSSVGHVLIDVDFACWGPFEAESKRDFLKKLKNSYQLEVDQCLSHRPEDGDHSQDLGGYPYHNLVDCSFFIDGTEWCYIPNAKSGEWYLLLITNYSRMPGEIHFERVAAQSTATTRCDVTAPVMINPVPKDLKQIDDHTSAICMFEDKALVTIELEPDEGYTFPEKSLKETQVEVFANGKTYHAELVDGHFECIIDIENDTTEYYANVRCPDPNFELQTEKHCLVRTTDCDPDKIPFARGETIHTDNVDFSELKRGTPIGVDISDKGGYENCNLNDYEVVGVEWDNPFIEEVVVEKDGNVLRVTPKLRGNWCECFMPDSLSFSVKMFPKNRESGVRPIEIPIIMGVSHHSRWIERCFWVVALIGGLLALQIYIFLLLKKRRFKKNAAIRAIPKKDGDENMDGSVSYELRKDGCSAWFVRWFVPGIEKSTLDFFRPDITVTFMATESGNMVEIPKSCIDPDRMSINGYEMEDLPVKKNPRLGPNDRIEVEKMGGNFGGILRFEPDDKTDGGGFRFFLGILLLIDILTVLVLLFLMIRVMF